MHSKFTRYRHGYPNRLVCCNSWCYKCCCSWGFVCCSRQLKADLNTSFSSYKEVNFPPFEFLGSKSVIHHHADTANPGRTGGWAARAVDSIGSAFFDDLSGDFFRVIVSIVLPVLSALSITWCSSAMVFLKALAGVRWEIKLQAVCLQRGCRVLQFSYRACLWLQHKASRMVAWAFVRLLPCRHDTALDSSLKANGFHWWWGVLTGDTSEGTVLGC